MLTDWNERRADIAQQYSQLLQGLPLWLPTAETSANPSWHLFVVKTPRRDALQRYLAGMGIETKIHYPLPPHRQPPYRHQFAPEAFPIANNLASEVLSLPIGPHMPTNHVTGISDAIKRFFETKEAGRDHRALSR